MLRPTVSKTRARAPTATVSMGRFSVKICETNYPSPKLVTATGIGKRHQFTRDSNSGKKTYRRSGASHEDQTAKVGGTLVAQRAGGVDESTDAVGLDGGADEGRSPRGGGTGGFLGPDELLLGVGGLGAVVRIAEDGGQDGERGRVCEDGA